MLLRRRPHRPAHHQLPTLHATRPHHPLMCDALARAVNQLEHGMLIALVPCEYEGEPKLYMGGWQPAPPLRAATRDPNVYVRVGPLHARTRRRARRRLPRHHPVTRG